MLLGILALGILALGILGGIVILVLSLIGGVGHLAGWDNEKKVRGAREEYREVNKEYKEKLRKDKDFRIRNNIRLLVCAIIGIGIACVLLYKVDASFRSMFH